MLNRPIIDDEIKEALFTMGPLKASGLNGFHALSYQNQWPVVGKSVCLMVKDIFEGGDLSEGINSTSIVLIPKVEHPENLSQFRPITLAMSGIN